MRRATQRPNLRKHIQVDVKTHSIPGGSKGCVWSKADLSITHPQDPSKSLHASVGKGRHFDIPFETIAESVHEGVCIIKVVLTITAEQRQIEVLNCWLMESGRVKAPLSATEAVAYLRSCYGGVNLRDEDALRANLEARGLSSEGQHAALQIRLSDHVGIEMQRSCNADVAQTCKSFALLIARDFRFLIAAATAAQKNSPWNRTCKRVCFRHGLGGKAPVGQSSTEQMSEDCNSWMRDLEKEEAQEEEVAKKSASLLLLDAACMSQVLSCEELDVKNERSLLKFVAQWASQPGRCIKVVDLVMPLGKFKSLPFRS